MHNWTHHFSSAPNLPTDVVVRKWGQLSIYPTSHHIELQLPACIYSNVGEEHGEGGGCFLPAGE